MKIVIKTTMRHIPKGCSRCMFYRLDEYTGSRICYAKAFKMVSPPWEKINVTFERPRWCPIEEVSSS